MIPLPFSKRETSSVAVFNCIFIASPDGAQQFVFGDGATIGALQLEYAQLVVAYALLRHQDTANNRVDLYSAITKALTAVSALNVTIEAIVVVRPAAHFLLAAMQTVVANALVSLQEVVSDE